ncbi:THUMP domain-containing class I SAM-dependent RNA methyltransferase [Pelagibacterium xiamenense]|uniref:THUMP domain-containing class I SAM-dependent RNA methyltransferase n=1 Tax=Pelagibacterium xiamenense TaxID=2901140 RepID=UPI001E29CFAC|nr:class I SAM-dependent RNA methyltransferase [Pelagibacterium xiamenense]MCD7059398.1 class I SAM-dependent RNA methyltransferase [Pelagibacterium xiamenense]
MTDTPFEIFLMAPPGLEPALAAEARAKGFADPRPVPGGVVTQGGWPDVWRANLTLRGAGHVLARIASFPAVHLAQLDKRARRVPWADVLKPGVPVRVEAVCRKSKIYHSAAAAQRIATAITEELGAPIASDAALVIKARIENDVVTISIDTSGASLHKRGHKEAVARAPMRETLAALFLHQCGYDGTEPVLDPMCGSGTFVIEAAEIAANLAPGRSRRFAFEDLATFEAEAWQTLRASIAPTAPSSRFFGSDRDPGAVRMSQANAERAGVSAWTEFTQQTVSTLTPPDGPPGLVIVNPPYGARIGNKGQLTALYAALGQTLATRFAGWRVGLITSDPTLAKSTRLPFLPTGAPVDNGGIRVTLYRTEALG